MDARRRNLVIFTAASLASGWVGVGVNRLTGTPDSLDSPGAGIWIATPLLTSIALRFLGTGWKDSGFNPRLPSRWTSYLAGAALFPAVTATVVAVGSGLGWIDTSALDMPKLLAAAGSGLGMALIKNFFEEAVWRGYLTEELMREKLSDLRLYLGVGLVWGLWHLPYFLFLLDEASMRTILDVPRLPWALIATATMVAWSVPYTELYRISRSIWPLVLMHAIEDVVVNPLLIDGHAKVEPGKAGLVSPVVGVLTSAAFVGVGLALRAWRKRKGL